MKTTHTIISSLIGLITVSSLQAATIFSNTANAVWENSGDWSGGVAPGTTTGQSDVAGVNAGRALTLNSDASGAGSISAMNVGNQNPGANVSNFTMTSSAILSVNNFYVGVNGAGGNFTYNDGASLTATTMLFGRNTTENGAPASSTVAFSLGAAGLTNAISTGQLNLRQVVADHAITIDASSYTGGEGVIDLISFTTHLGGDFGSTSITGLGPGLAGAITYDADSVNLSITAVPEPSSTALLGLGGLALLMRRKK